jgi:hypothetical protein
VSEPTSRPRNIEEDTMFRTKTSATKSITDELELTLETLKDLTVTAREAVGVKGGKTSLGQNCYCGSM